MYVLRKCLLNKMAVLKQTLSSCVPLSSCLWSLSLVSSALVCVIWLYDSVLVSPDGMILFIWFLILCWDDSRSGSVCPPKRLTGTLFIIVFDIWGIHSQRPKNSNNNPNRALLTVILNIIVYIIPVGLTVGWLLLKKACWPPIVFIWSVNLICTSSLPSLSYHEGIGTTNSLTFLQVLCVLPLAGDSLPIGCALWTDLQPLISQNDSSNVSTSVVVIQPSSGPPPSQHGGFLCSCCHCIHRDVLKPFCLGIFLYLLFIFIFLSLFP